MSSTRAAGASLSSHPPTSAPSSAKPSFGSSSGGTVTAPPATASSNTPATISIPASPFVDLSGVKSSAETSTSTPNPLIRNSTHAQPTTQWFGSVAARPVGNTLSTSSNLLFGDGTGSRPPVLFTDNASSAPSAGGIFGSTAPSSVFATSKAGLFASAGQPQRTTTSLKEKSISSSAPDLPGSGSASGASTWRLFDKPTASGTGALFSRLTTPSATKPADNPIDQETDSTISATNPPKTKLASLFSSKTLAPTTPTNENVKGLLNGLGGLSYIPQVVMTPRGLQPDMILRVFRWEFHVHSVTMKSHSAFFRKFLDSPDKPSLKSTAFTAFKYEWDTQVDKNGSWSLTCYSKLPEITDYDKIRAAIDVNAECLAFHNLMRAFHSEPLCLYSIEQLDRATQLADYYRSLPVLSGALSARLLDSPALTSGIAVDPFRLLQIATKLHNSVLFRECVIHLLNPFHNPSYKETDMWDDQDHTGLKKLLDFVYSSIWAQIAKIEHALLTAEAYTQAAYASAAKTAGNSCKTVDDSANSVVNLPEYYRQLYECRQLPKPLKNLIKPLLKNNLKLDSRESQAGESGAYKNYFLCASIEDEDLPWDLNKRDW
ncbi:hypothetical protein LCER1_G005999 [Lachnellula cervina]|uniref:BTB domain-containing protein n=1 Tax=Lachnellula cervina TaxID=1316786 RepID=A0A7D8YQJ1_9HELO|nr:hypothetical protein LCER1_G005999 [Lachnellula cervina]